MNGSVRRRLLWLHRWIGALCTLFLIVLSLTGLALNHSARLGLDRHMIRAEWVLEQYGMAFPKPDQAIELDGRYAAIIDGEFWWNGVALAPLERLIGVTEGEGWVLFGGMRRALLTTTDGELIDILDYPPEVTAPRWGRIGSRAAMESGGKRWSCRESLDGWELDTGHWSPTFLSENTLPEPVYVKWKNEYTGAGLSLYRVILDMHAGRFFGLPGTIAMDATALAILYLCGSGLAVCWTRRRVKGRG